MKTITMISVTLMMTLILTASAQPVEFSEHLPPGMAEATASAQAHLPQKPRQLRSQQERVIAESDYLISPDTVFTLRDSISCTYSAGRGAGYEYLYTCDSAIVVTSSGSSIQRNQLVLNYFDGTGNLATALYFAENGSSLDTSYEILYTYDANHNMLTNTVRNYMNSIWSAPQSSYVYTYDIYNRVASMEFEYINGSNVLTPNTLTTYTYEIPVDTSVLYSNVLNQYWNTNSSTWANGSNQTWIYDGNYNDTVYQLQSWTGTAWADSLKSIITFDPGSITCSLPASQINQSYHLGWQNRDEYLFAYNTNSVETLFAIQKWTGAAWQDSLRDMYTINSYGGVTYYTDIHQVSGYPIAGWLNANQTDITYDSYNNPSFETTFSWNGNFWAPNQSLTFYYELYEPAGIAAVPDPKGNLNLYPSPAGSVLNIDLSWNDAQAARIGIYDASGRLYRQWESTTGTSYQSNISVSEMPVGTYYMSVQGQSGQISKSFSVVK